MLTEPSGSLSISLTAFFWLTVRGLSYPRDDPALTVENLIVESGISSRGFVFLFRDAHYPMAASLILENSLRSGNMDVLFLIISRTSASCLLTCFIFFVAFLFLCWETNVSFYGILF